MWPAWMRWPGAAACRSHCAYVRGPECVANCSVLAIDIVQYKSISFHVSCFMLILLLVLVCVYL